MSPSNQLTREELLDMAQLEALGVLDEYEQALFSRALSNAATAVQEEIRNLQASIVADTSLLPDDEPSVELRHGVLAAVAHAIDEENEQLAPLATIGGMHRHAGGAVSAGAVIRSQVYLWRAAAFALAAGLLVCLFFLGRVVETNKTIASARVTEHNIDVMVDLAGVDLRGAFNRQHTARAIPAVLDTAKSGCGVVLIDEQRDRATFFLHGLNPTSSGAYEIVVYRQNPNGTDDKLGKLGPIQKFAGQTIAAAHFELAHIGEALPHLGALANLATYRIDIVAADGTVVMSAT